VERIQVFVYPELQVECPGCACLILFLKIAIKKIIRSAVEAAWKNIKCANEFSIDPRWQAKLAGDGCPF